MKILIASDLHGSLNALNFLRKKIEELIPQQLLLLGDLVYHGPRNPLPNSYDTKAILTEMPELTAEIPISCVRGNCDAEVDVAQMPFAMPESAWIFDHGLQIFASHGHHLPDHAPIADFAPGTVFLRGHTHIPRAETEGDQHFWNPGSLSLPKGGFPPSYAVYENGIFSVYDIFGNMLMRHQPKPISKHG